MENFLSANFSPMMVEKHEPMEKIEDLKLILSDPSGISNEIVHCMLKNRNKANHYGNKNGQIFILTSFVTKS